MALLEFALHGLGERNDRRFREIAIPFGDNDWVAVRGYDKKMGARPMARVIQEHIKRPLAEELLFGKLAEGGHVRVEVGADGESLELTVEPLKRELEDLRGKGSAQRELAGHKGEE